VHGSGAVPRVTPATRTSKAAVAIGDPKGRRFSIWGAPEHPLVAAAAPGWPGGLKAKKMPQCPPVHRGRVRRKSFGVEPPATGGGGCRSPRRNTQQRARACIRRTHHRHAALPMRGGGAGEFIAPAWVGVKASRQGGGIRMGSKGNARYSCELVDYTGEAMGMKLQGAGGGGGRRRARKNAGVYGVTHPPCKAAGGIAPQVLRQDRRRLTFFWGGAERRRSHLWSVVTEIGA
jgi:hypothetical protein